MSSQKPDENTEKSKKTDDKLDVSNESEKAKPDLRKTPEKPREIGGPEGPEPTRYGDWEVGGRCSDF